MHTYLFYDLETSGLSPAFDQVYQFAAIRTDLDLNEIARYEFLVKPTVDVIPSPEAMITHRLSLRQLQQEGLPEHEAIRHIHALLNEPGTISLGYNTLSFDDEFLRFSFYRHLLTPYTHQFANQCRRMDLFPMVVFYYLGRRNHLEWGLRNDKLSLKLEDLAEKNNLASGPAHQAMVDVEATLALAKKLKEDTKLWENLLGCFIKSEESARLVKLPLIPVEEVGYPFGLAVNGRFGVDQAYQVYVLGLGQHWHYKNQTIWLNLEDARILSGDPAVIPEMWTLKKRLGEPPFILQAESRFNQVGENRQTLARETLQFLQRTPGYFKAIQSYALNFKFPVYNEVDEEAKLYQLSHFWTDQELIEMQDFWRAPAKEKEKRALRFQNPTLQALAHRMLGRFYPEHLSVEAQGAFQAYLSQIWRETGSKILDYKREPRLTRSVALERINAIDKASLDKEQGRVLTELHHYLQRVPRSLSNMDFGVFQK